MGTYTTPTLDFVPKQAIMTGMLNGQKFFSIYDADKYGSNVMVQIYGTSVADITLPNSSVNGIGSVDTVNKKVTFLTNGNTNIDIYVMGY